MENEQALVEAISRNNELIARRLMFDKDWKIPIRNGILVTVYSNLSESLGVVRGSE